MTETFLFLAGVLFGLSFLGGFYLYAIPLGVLCLIFGWLNRPVGRTIARRVTERFETTPGAPEPERGTEFPVDSDIRSIEASEPANARLKRKLYAEVDNEIDAVLYESLSVLRCLLPKVHSVCIFFPSRRNGYFELRVFHTPSSDILPGAQIAQNQGLVGQLLKKEIKRVVEGDISGSSTLYYYRDEVDVKSIAAVPILVKQRLSGAVVVDSLEKSAFDLKTVGVLRSFAQVVGAMTYKSYMEFEHLYQKEQFAALYAYQKKFFSNMAVKDIYGYITEYVNDFLPYERVMILALDTPESSHGRVVACKGKDEAFFQNQEFSLEDKGLLILSFLKSFPINRHFSPDEQVQRIRLSEKESSGFRCLMAVPVCDSEDRVTEVICVESMKHSRYSEHELGLLTSISSVAAFALSRARAYEEKQDLASKDGLTGLCNHRTFQEKLRVEMMRATRMGSSIGLMMTDIDHFKSVNDTYGHPIGDIVLKETSRLIQREVRSGVDLVARYGGEEFVVMLIDASEESLKETAERIREAIAEKDFDIGRADPLQITTSIGYALFPRDSGNVKEVLDRADRALYRAKDSGRNKVVGYR